MLRSRMARWCALAGAAACLAAPAAQAHVGTGAMAKDPTAAALRATTPPGQTGEPGAPGIGDPYFPLEGNGGYDTQHYDLSFSYDPATDRLEGLAVITARATQDLSRFDLDLQQLEVYSVTRRSPCGELQPRRAGAADHAPQRPPRGPRRSSSTVRYGGVPQTIVGSPIVFGSPVRLPAHRRRRVPWATSPTSPRPGSRSPTTRRTRRVHVPRDGPQGPRRRRQRRAQVPGGHRRLVAVRLGRAGPDGVLPRDRRHRPLDRQAGPHAGRDPGVRRRRPGAAGRDGSATAADRGVDFFYDYYGRGHRPVGADVRPVSVRERRRDRRQRDLQRHAARLLAGDADQAGLLGRPQPEHDRSRAGAPVVRRQRLGAHVGQHLAQRGLRDLRRSTCGASTSARARAHDAFLADYARPATIVVLADRGRRPAARHDVRQRRLSPRRR